MMASAMGGRLFSARSAIGRPIERGDQLVPRRPGPVGQVLHLVLVTRVLAALLLRLGFLIRHVLQLVGGDRSGASLSLAALLAAPPPAARAALLLRDLVFRNGLGRALGLLRGGRRGYVGAFDGGRCFLATFRGRSLAATAAAAAPAPRRLLGPLSRGLRLLACQLGHDRLLRRHLISDALNLLTD